MIKDLIDMPQGWQVTTIEKVASNLKSGSGFPKSYQGQDKGKYPFAKVGDISKCFRAGNKYISAANNYISEDVRQKIKAKVFPTGTIVFPKIGEAIRGNYRLICRSNMIFDNNVMGILPSKIILEDYLLYFLLTQDFGAFSVATTVPSVRRGDIESISLPFAPLNEQKRIVEKIEELFSELDKGIESLQTAKQQLKIYRQALLKHAFEGKLTAKWREENKDKLEPAEKLLERIQQEREQRYEEKLEQWKQDVKTWEIEGKKGKKLNKPKALVKLLSITEKELENLPELPSQWKYVGLGLVVDEPKYGTSKKCDYKVEGIGVLRIPNIVEGVVDASDLKFAQFDSFEVGTYSLIAGDILTIRSNGSVSIVGKCAMITSNEEKYLYAGYLIRLRPNNHVAMPEYLIMVLSSHTLRVQIEDKAKSTSGVNNINSGEIQSLIIPMCSIEEQNIIYTILESRFTVVDQFLMDIDVQLQKAETLRQSILKRAFSGKLVPQDPNDEPASVLLERIKAEKAVQEAKLKTKKKKKIPKTKQGKTA